MRAILGIGNPGRSYSLNRHNAGFLMLDYFADKYSFSFNPSRYDYYYSKGELSNDGFLLVKPTTYVNNSGLVARHIVNYYNLDTNDLLVVVDDVNLELAKLRLRKSGGDGGHNGMHSIIYHLQTDQFPRLRIGVGNDIKKEELVDFVLGDFSEKELNELEPSFKDGSFLFEAFIKGGINYMLDANSKLNKNKSEELKNNKQDNGDQENL